MRPKLLMAGDAGSVHFYRWAGFVHEAGFAVDILTYESPEKMDPTLAYDSAHLLRRSRTRLSKLLSIILDIVSVNYPAYTIANFHYLTLRWAVYVLARRGPSLITCWGSDILIHYQHARGFGKAILKGALRKAAAITCDSEEVRKIISEGTGQPEKVHLIYWGVDTRRFWVTPASRTAARHRYGIPLDSTVILSIRRVTPHFQIDQLIEWFAGSISNPRIILFMHAVPELEPGYASRCLRRASGIGNIRVNTKKLTVDEMVELYALSDIDIHNPVSDATPVSMLEGIACRNLQLCRTGISAYRDLGRLYTIEKFDSLGDVTEERIGMMQAAKERIADRNLGVLKTIHSEEQTVGSLTEILRYLAGDRLPGR